MTQKLLQSATTLADTLAAENRALAGLDFAAAVKLLDAKMRATDDFAAAQAPVPSTPDELLTRRRLMADVAGRLRDLTAENMRLLDRAVMVQGRVIGAIVRAVPKAVRGPARYGARGALTGAARMQPITLSARA